MSESTSTSYSCLQPYSSESPQTASTRHSNVTEPVVSKRICFYKSGDPQFNGINMVVSNRTFKTFDSLLDGLSKKVPLPFGVRNISTPRGIHQVSALDELEDGKSYICSHQKKIKPINLERASRKPLLWQSSRPISARRRVVQLLRKNEVNPIPGDNTAVPGLSKKLIIFKNGDTGFKHTIILNRKTTQTFEALLDHMTDVLQCPVTKLYTADGRRIFGMQALLLSSGAIVAAGRESFKPGNYDSKKESLPLKLPGIPRRVLPKARNKPEARNPGQWKVSIFTSDMPPAGTTAQVYITLYGHHRCSGPTFLYGGEEDLFQSGHQDIFTINSGDIGDIYKIRIGHNNSGDSPAWHCEEVQLQNLYTKEQFYIPVHRWLALDQEDGEICRELPVLRPGHPILPVTIYDVHVVTGDLWNAGTGANVYISIYGERGDTGSRHLLKSRKPKTFSKGQTDIFQLEAVHLGNAYKIVIGHDGLGAGNGWYLEKVIVQDHIKDTEYVFLCHRWLDEGEDDGKIVRELYTDISNFSAKQELELKRKEIWGAERWKYQKGNTLQFYCKVTRRLIRLMPDGTVDARGDKKDRYGFFDVTVKRGSIRVFTSRQIRHLALAIDKGFASGMDNYGNLCELQLHVHPNRCVTLESVRAPGHTITFNPEGKPAEGAATGYAGLSKEFVVHVKGVFRNGAVVLLTTNWYQALCLRDDGSCSATGIHSEESYWKVHKISSGVCMFESVRIPRMFLRIRDTHCDGTGTGDQYCHFKIEKNLENGSICLESVKNRGMYVGFLTDGRTKPLVHTGERNIMIYPQVIKFGREKPMGTSATASQEKEVINIYEQDPEKPQKPVALSPSDSPALSKRETKTVPAPSEDDWKVLVLTGDTGTRAPVTLWVYGDKGASGPVKLEKDEMETLFIAHQEDEFKVKLKNIGLMYKIRIGHDGSSDQPEWKLQRVTLVNMKSKKIMQFEVNRWLSRNQSDNDIVCEIPVTKNGKAVYPVVRYLVYVYTGNLQHAETNSPVYLCIHGERGDSGLRLLHKSDAPFKFRRGQVDMFEVEAVSLGKLRTVLLQCDSSSKPQSWYCKKVLIKEPGRDSEYIFSCERWFPFMSNGRMHSEIELQVQDTQIKDHANELEKIIDGEWNVTVVTGNSENSGTDATVVFYAYGKKQNSGAIILGSGKDKLFNSNSVDTFKVNLKHLGELHKIRIGHDNSGENPGWYLEEVTLRDMVSGTEVHLAVNRWLHEEKDDGDTWREIAVPRPKKELLKVLNYEIHVYTGPIPGAGTDSNVYINLFGTRGDSGNRKLRRSKNHKTTFQQGQVDVFNIEAVSLGDLKKVVIGHDGIDPGNGWFLDKVKVKIQENGNEKAVVFPCNSWLDKHQGDGKTVKELLPKKNNDSLQSSAEENNDSLQTPAEENNEFQPTSRKGGQWKIIVKTAKDSPEPGESRISIAIYGSNGKTGDQLLSPSRVDSMCFLPGAVDEFFVNTSDVGEVYKVRVMCDNIPAFKGWNLKSLLMKEEETNQEIKCTCNWWFSTSQEKVEMIKEFPAEIRGTQHLPVNKYYVSVYTGDQWGAETFANVYLTIYGKRGDTGARKLEQSLTSGKPFQRNKMDSFVVEAVSLSHLQKIVVGHDGGGYGSGMFLKMVTVRESQSAIHEWVFPFWNWLDSHIGPCQTVGKLITLGKRQVSNPWPSQMSKQSSGTWIMDLSGSAMEDEMGPVQLSLVFYGKLGHKRLLAEITSGSAKIEDELRDVGVISKVQITSGADSALQQQWHLDYMHMKHTGSQQEMWIEVNCWFKPDEENCVERPALYAGQDPVPVIEYTVYVHTGSDKNAEACGEVYLSIHGERGNSGKRRLRNSGAGPITFCRGKVDVFRLTAVHLGKLREITIGFSSSKEDSWLLNKIIVKEEGYFPSAEYDFVHNEWISQHSKKEFTETVIPVKGENVTSDIVKQIDSVSKGEWYMWLESSLPEEVPDIDVILYGRNGKSPPQKVKNLINDPFLLHAQGIGEIIKVSFELLDSHLKRGLKLKKLRLKDLDTKEELGFQTAERWLFEEDGSETVTELAAVRPGRAPLNEVLYSVSVYTGTLPASETDADVFLTMFGENGDSCKRQLKSSSSPTVFEKGQVNIFTIRAIDLGMISKVIVGHNAVGYGAGWYLDHITIQESGLMDTEYWFQCQKWLDSEINDKKTELEIKLLGKVKKRSKGLKATMHGAWDVFVETSDVSSSGSEVEVTLTICCENGSPTPIFFPRGCLHSGQIYKTTIELEERLGAVQKVRLQREDLKNGDDWHCREVRLQHKQNKDILEFPFLRNFSHSEGCDVAELPVLMAGSSNLSVKTYFLYITTHQSSKSETDADVHITLRGTFGDTGRRRLSLQGEKFFQKGKVDTRCIEAVDIGQLQELYLEKGKDSGWQPEKIVVQEGEYAKKKITFPFQRWVKDRKNKTSAATLHVEEAQEVSDGEAFPAGGEPMQSEGEWNVYLTKRHLGGPRQSADTKDSSCHFFMVFYGTRGTSSPIEMENGKQSQSLDQITCTVHLPLDLGELYKVRLGLQNLKDQTSELFLQHFKMQNTATCNTFSHSINKTLPLPFNGDRCIEIPVEWPLKASLSEVTYQVNIMSSRYVEKRNISQVSLCLYGANGDTGERYISKLCPDKQKENSNQCFSVAVYAAELGELQKISLSISNRNGYKLYVEKVHVKESTKQHRWIFDVNEEFSGDTHKDDIQREFLLSHGHNEVDVPLSDSVTYSTPGRQSSEANEAEFLIKVYTGDVMGAGTDAKVHIVLIGEHGSSGRVHLTESLEHKNPFERAKVDTFRITTKRLGSLFKIEIGHDGKGYGSGWFVEKVEITDLFTNEMHTFSCNRWLTEDEEDGQTVVQFLI